MRKVKSFSITRQCDKDAFDKFDKIRHMMKLKTSEGILRAINEFTITHPLEKLNILDSYIENDKKLVNIPMISIYTDTKEISKICVKAKNQELIDLKNSILKVLHTVEKEIDNRFE